MILGAKSSNPFHTDYIPSVFVYQQPNEPVACESERSKQALKCQSMYVSQRPPKRCKNVATLLEVEDSIAHSREETVESHDYEVNGEEIHVLVYNEEVDKDETNSTGKDETEINEDGTQVCMKK